MYVVKRDGRRESVKFDKITARIKKLCYGLNPLVTPEIVAMKVIEGLYDGVTTSELDNLAAEVAATNTITHPDYALLASRIAVYTLHKNTKKSFSETVKDLYEYIDPKTNEKAPLISDEVYSVIKKNADVLDSTIIYDRDFRYDFFGFKTLEKSYLFKIKQLTKIANKRGQSLPQMALSWILRHPTMTSALIGARTVKQLDECLDSQNNLTFSNSELKEIDKYAKEEKINLWVKSSTD